MRKIAVILLLVMMANMFVGCSQGKTSVEQPEIGQVRAICDLATLKCSYHNVAKIEKKAGTGILHIGEVDRKLWIEYKGYVTIGIDMSKVTMEVEGEKVTVFIPKATVLDAGREAKEEHSVISSDDSWFNANKITAEEQTAALNQAQAQMRETASQNSTLLTTAQNRAKALIQNYIKRLGELSNIEYKIEWKHEI